MRDKPDANKAEIVADLRARGLMWLDIGGSVDGVCIGYHREQQMVMAVLVEIKQPEYYTVAENKPYIRFTASEKKLINQLLALDFQGVHVVATCVEDVLRWFGGLA